jgi:hypothetical protein
MQKRMGAQGRGVGRVLGAGRRASFALPFLACLFTLALASPAQATFHEMSIREVYPGGADNASYVELQMWAGGQEFVGGHHLIAYNPDGSVNEDFTFPSSVANGATQSTILVADSSYGSVFAGKPAPDAGDEKLNLSPQGGAVCWVEGSPPDCVAWGDFTGPLPAHAPTLKVGNPAAPTGVKAGKALRRSIAKGCATLLDLPTTEDSDDSATDFSEVEPAPRNNATAPTEHACPVLPNTTIDAKPASPTKATAAAFTYHATPAAEAEFECRLDGVPFTSCSAGGKEYPGPLAEGSHTFEVRAANLAGADPTPASYMWTIDGDFVDETPPQTTIGSRPSSPNSNSTASFTYSSSEAGSSFECRLDGGPFSACQAVGISYTDLGAGPHTFEVRAIDPSSNVDPTPASFSFEIVFAQQPPVTPAQAPTPTSTPAPPAHEPPQAPSTTLFSKPAPRAHDRTPTFRFRSDSTAATFQCKLDQGAFRACRSPLTTKKLTYGSHILQIRAVMAGIVDPSPASAHFKVVKP